MDADDLTLADTDYGMMSDDELDALIAEQGEQWAELCDSVDRMMATFDEVTT